MLGYQSTSFQRPLAMRDLFGRRPAPEFEAAARQVSPTARRVRPPHAKSISRAAAGVTDAPQ